MVKERVVDGKFKVTDYEVKAEQLKVKVEYRWVM